jgi:hypothetical protein
MVDRVGKELLDRKLRPPAVIDVEPRVVASGRDASQKHAERRKPCGYLEE